MPENNRARLIAITGASGYIGKSLTKHLMYQKGTRFRILSRNQNEIFPQDGANLEVYAGDLKYLPSLVNFLEPNCTVVNLAYLWGKTTEENLNVMLNLVEACKRVGIKRFIHCSTAAVIGRASDNLIREETPCRPYSHYAVTKHLIEELILKESRGNFETVILRPTSVFGPGYAPLQKLSFNLSSGNRLKNYLRSSLFGKRYMNLVHIDNVVAAFLFIISIERKLDGEIFFISDDNSDMNNFRDIEKFLIKEFDCLDYRISPFPMPPILLSVLLCMLGRNNINPKCLYSGEKLFQEGFRKSVSFEAGLRGYAAWYKNNFMTK